MTRTFLPYAGKGDAGVVAKLPSPLTFGQLKLRLMKGIPGLTYLDEQGAGLADRKEISAIAVVAC